jgi:SGNH hydrolase-like domain, acetyltransferase AlgX
MAQKLLPVMDPAGVFAFVVFEGNDFETDARSYEGINSYDRLRGHLIATILPFLSYPRVIFGISRQAERTIGIVGRAVEVFPIGGKDVGFFKSYIDAAVSPNPKYHIVGDEQVLGRMGCVFFVPVKYRVYKEFINDGRTLPEGPPGLNALRAYYAPHGVPVVDLTPVLRQAARAELAQGHYVYWRDDTHWNGIGIRAVAQEVKNCLMSRIKAD